VISLLRGRPRLIGGIIVGIALWWLLPAVERPVSRAILAWDGGVAVFLAASLHLFLTHGTAHLPQDAAAQEEGEWTIFGLTLLGTIASLGAIINEFAALHAAPSALRWEHVLLVAATLILSWLMTQTTFAFRYAHEFYSRTDPAQKEVDGGLIFPGEDAPDYLDFFYFAMVLGMTFQVSDVQITSRKLRRLATLHGLLGFGFNTVILALSVNLAAGLLG
jgi:uncharacterized membrane protein